MVTALLTAGILQGIFLMLLLVRRQQHPLSNRILAGLIAVVVVHLGLIVLDVNDLFLVYPHLSRLSWLLPLLYGPLILVLTQSILSPSLALRPGQLLLLLPFFTYLVILLPYFSESAEAKLAYLSDANAVHLADFGWMNHVTNYLHIGFVGISIWLYEKSKRRDGAVFSGTGRRHWLGQFLWVFMIILVFALLTFYAKKLGWAHLSAIYPKHFILAVIFIYWVAYKLLRETEVEPPAPQTEEMQEVKSKYAKTGLNETTSKSIAASLTELMHSDKPYLNPELTLADLSQRLSVPKHQLSQVINSEFQMNFNEFVNSYRLRLFKEEILNPANAHLSMLGVAFECGFNSKAAFNQYFKKKEGTTPSEFLKAIQGQKIT